MTTRSGMAWLLCSIGIFGNLLTSCESVEGCEYTASCPGGGAGGRAGGGSGGAQGGTTGGRGGSASSGGGQAGISGSASGGQLGEAGSGGTSQAGESGAPSSSGGSVSHAGAPSDAEAGAGGRPACDGACGGTTPVCDAPNDVCVECLGSEHCSAKAPACDPIAKTCVECLTDTECGPSAPACKLETRTCVACTNDEHCPSTTPFCDVTANACVACLKPADCTSANASRCDAGTCKPCSANSDCSQISGRGICDAGQCVQCTSTDETPCAGKSCNPATRRCTTTALASVGICKGCVADSECIGSNLPDPDMRCVPMQFKGAALPGGFCLPRQSKACDPPFNSPFEAVSLSRVPSESYCGVVQMLTRCAAVLDMMEGRTCPSGQDASCGCPRDANGNCTALGEGGLCRPVGNSATRCSYPCGSNPNCTIDTTCSPTLRYCL